MPTVDAPCRTETTQAATLLAHIAQVVIWLPKREPTRPDLVGALAQMEQHLADGALTRGEILNFQVNVWRLQGSPLRTLLNRRVAELGELYGLRLTEGRVRYVDAGSAEASSDDAIDRNGTGLAL